MSTWLFQGYMTELDAKNACEWETKLKSFKERGSKLLKWDPSAAKNKEKPETNELIEEEEDLGLLPPTQEEQTHEEQNVRNRTKRRIKRNRNQVSSAGETSVSWLACRGFIPEIGFTILNEMC